MMGTTHDDPRVCDSVTLLNCKRPSGAHVFIFIIILFYITNLFYFGQKKYILVKGTLIIFVILISTCNFSKLFQLHTYVIQFINLYFNINKTKINVLYIFTFFLVDQYRAIVIYLSWTLRRVKEFTQKGRPYPRHN